MSRLPTGQPEIFLSIQGEGASLGTQSVFLRLALCNLACIWCDTKYTWDWHNYDYHREAMELTQQQVEESITKYPCHHLVITGGEPLLQKRALEPLVRSLKSKGFSLRLRPTAPSRRSYLGEGHRPVERFAQASQLGQPARYTGGSKCIE